jgi:hypothetical protein
MFRHVLRSMLLRSTIAATLIFGLCSLAAAQYGGGGMGGGGMPGSPTYTNRSYSSKGAIIGGVAAGAAVVGGLLYWRHHNRAKLVGCVQGNGKLVSDKDNQTYSLSNPQNETLKSGERVELLGKKAKDETDEPTFEVRKMNKDLGMCTPTSAAK